MRQVLIISEERGDPAAGTLHALREAGFALTPVADAPSEAGSNGKAAHGNEAADGVEAPPFAVLYEVTARADIAAVHAAACRARARWPGTPLVACRRDNPAVPAPSAARVVGPALLKRLGFHAVADEPAQIPSVLRDLEMHGFSTAEVVAPEREVETPPPSLLLPERLSVRRLRAAFETVTALHFASDQKGAAQAALAGLASLVRADRWTIYLAGEMSGASQEQELEPLAVRGLTLSERQLPEGDWRRALLGEALALSGLESEAARRAVAAGEVVRKKEGERRTLAVPLTVGDRVLGVLEGVREGEGARPFTRSEAALLSAVALPVAAALANSVRIAEAERLSQTDDLTKLHNARFLRQFLTNELKRARRYGSTVSAMFLDLDDFKATNDRHGHLVGSHVLMEMAAVILSSVRDTDVVVRYGGDEFVVILPETGAEQSARVAERVRERIARHVFTGGRNLRLSLTGSFGIATFPAHAQSPQQLIASADAAMYDAKADRKNCVRSAPPQPAGA